MTLDKLIDKAHVFRISHSAIDHVHDFPSFEYALISNCYDSNWALSILFCPIIWKEECDRLCLTNLKELELTSCKKILCPRQIISTLHVRITAIRSYPERLCWYCSKCRERTLNLSCIMLKNDPTYLKMLQVWTSWNKSGMGLWRAFLIFPKRLYSPGSNIGKIFTTQ